MPSFTTTTTLFNDASTLVAFLLAGGSTYTLLYYVLCRFVFLFFFVYYLLLLSLSLRRVRRAVVLDAIVIDLNNVPTHVDSFSLSFSSGHYTYYLWSANAFCCCHFHVRKSVCYVGVALVVSPITKDNTTARGRGEKRWQRGRRGGGCWCCGSVSEESHKEMPSATN